MSGSGGNPLVSILVPVRNRARLLAYCVNSALSQSLADLEVVIADNASDDGTWGVCEDLARRDGRVRIFRQATNCGPVLNWKFCINQARGAFGRLLFSDDLLKPDCLERSVPMLQSRPDVAFVLSCIETIDEHSKRGVCCMWGDRFPDGMMPSSWFRYNVLVNHVDLPVSPCAALFRLHDMRRNLMDDLESSTVRDFRDHGCGPDEVLMLLTAHAYPWVGYVPRPLVVFRSHSGAFTRRMSREHYNDARYQAKVWFASRYEAADVLRDVLCSAWITRLMACRRPEWPSATARRYLDRPVGSASVLRCLRLIWHWIRMRRVSWWKAV